MKGYINVCVEAQQLFPSTFDHDVYEVGRINATRNAASAIAIIRNAISGYSLHLLKVATKKVSSDLCYDNFHYIITKSELYD